MAKNGVTAAYTQATISQQQLITAQAAQAQAIQQFKNLYLSPQGDANSRVGTTISTTKDPVDASAFPPFQNISVEPDPTLGTALRSGGFIQVNKQINDLQMVVLFLTGQIRTKLTEWDISIYLQEGLIDKDVSNVEEQVKAQIQATQARDTALGIPKPPLSAYYLTGHFYSLLYNMVKDNPMGYSEPRQAAVFGMLNAALTSWRHETWDPRFDPDLQYWVYPTTINSLISLSENFAKEQAAANNIFGDYSTVVRTNLPASSTQPTPLATLLKEHKNDSYWIKQIRAYWGGNPLLGDLELPKYWQLFFTSPNYLPTSNDQQNFESYYDSYRTTDQAAPSSTNAIGLNTASSIGLNGNSVEDSSPIFSGGPYGSKADPRSLGSFFVSGYDFPKLPPTRGSIISQSYISSDPYDEFFQLNAAWFSQTPILSASSYAVPAVSVTNVTKNNYGQITGSSTAIEKVLSPVLRSVWAILNPTTERAYGYGAQQNVTIPTFQATGSYNQKTGYWPNGVLVTQNAVPNIVDGIIVGPKSKITLVPYGDATNVFSQLSVGESAAITLVTQDKKYVVEAVIKHETRTIYVPGTTYKFLSWTWTPSVAVTQDILTIDAYTGVDLYPVDLSDFTQEDVTTPRLTSIAQFFANPGVTFQGLYFSIPQRTLTNTQSVIRDGWTTLGTPIPQDQGIALARSRLTFLWRNGDLVSFPSSVAPFRGMLKAFHRTISPLFSRIQESIIPILDSLSLSALQLVFTPGQVLDASTLSSMVDVQNYFMNSNLTQLSNEFVQAKQTFQNFVNIFIDQTPGSNDPTQLGLLSLVEYLCGLGSYAVPVGTNVTHTLDQRFTLAAYNQFKNFYFTQLSNFTTATSQTLQLYKMLDKYLRVLYERRFSILKARLNISGGTLLQVARMESAILLVQQTTQPPTTSSLGQSPLEDLPVVFQVTSQTQSMKAIALANNITLPPELLLIVYTPVQYDNSNNIIRPSTGTYYLVSMEYALDTKGKVPQVSFPLTFVEGNAPPIIHGVPTGIDTVKFAEAQAQNALTLQEKICFAVQINDLWEIVIPTPQPLRSDYLTNLHLMTMPPTQAIEDVTAILGGGTPSPVHEQPTNTPIPASTWISAPNSTQTAAGLSSDA